VIITLIGFIF